VGSEPDDAVDLPFIPQTREAFVETSAAQLIERLDLLGFNASEVTLDRWSSPIAALACFPMYMVANVHAWTADKQFKIPVLDIPGFEALRESVEIGRQEGRLSIEEHDAKVVDSMLASAKAPDRVIYAYALETLRDFLTLAAPTFAAEVRTAVARMIVAVARASGEGLFGTGPKVSGEERACVAQIVASLSLTDSPAATTILNTLDQV
jgi:hypothetical protein